MTDLTQQILALDKESETAIKNAHLAEQETKRKADSLAESTRKETQLLFEEQKSTEVALLTQKMRDARQNALTALHHKIEKFDTEVSLERIVEYLFKAAKDRVCR